MSAKHSIEAEELMAYLDGEFRAEQASIIVSHLETCAACQKISADLRSVSRQLIVWETETLDSEIPFRIVAALKEKAQKPEVNEINEHLGWKAKKRRWVWVGAFAALCLFIGVGEKVAMLYRNVGQPMSSTRLFEPEPPASIVSQARRMGQSTDHRPQALAGIPSEDKKGGSGNAAISAALINPGEVPPVAGPMVVRTAGITVTVQDLDKARATLDDILRRHNGYIAELNLNTSSGASRNFTSTLRVPASELAATIVELRNFGRVESESQSGEEVTDQYVDLQARLSNAHNTEQRLTDLLRQRTGKLSDVLAVETELDRVRGEIERMEAERKNLANKVDFATINATVSEDYRAQLQVVPSTTWGQIRNAAVEGYGTMAESLIAGVLFLFSYGPSILLWGAILFLPARYAWRNRQRMFHR
jgi:anti-sigma factor RsiW